MAKFFLTLLLMCFTLPASAACCKLDHVKQNIDHGTVIILSQNIPWQIDKKDWGDTTLWQRGDHVFVCDTGMIYHYYYDVEVGARRFR